MLTALYILPEQVNSFNLRCTIPGLSLSSLCALSIVNFLRFLFSQSLIQDNWIVLWINYRNMIENWHKEEKKYFLSFNFYSPFCFSYLSYPFTVLFFNTSTFWRNLSLPPALMLRVGCPQYWPQSCPQEIKPRLLELKANLQMIWSNVCSDLAL